MEYMHMQFSLTQRIYIFTVGCCFLFAILLASILWASQKIELAFKREKYAQQVDNHTNSLTQHIISNQLYASLHKDEAWLLLHQKLLNILERAPELTPKQQTIQNSINSQSHSVTRLYSEIVKLAPVNNSIREHLLSRLISQLESIRADSVQLSANVQQDINQVIERQVVFILLLFLLCIAVLLYGAVKLTKVFKKSLQEVTYAFQENHSGHFQKIKLTHNTPEFNSIAQAFNAMNLKLNETMVSLEVMKKVVEERTHSLEQLSNTDPLTQVANRRALFERGHMEFSRVLRNQKQLTLVLLDCDFFKDINDEFGHLFGDKLLQHLCQTCKQTIREVDFLARYGGEEFIIILPECDEQGGIDFAKRIQQSLASHALKADDKDVYLTVSIGITEMTERHKSFEQLINDADQAMYQAKKKGRNRIEVTHSAPLH